MDNGLASIDDGLWTMESRLGPRTLGFLPMTYGEAIVHCPQTIDIGPSSIDYRPR